MEILLRVLRVVRSHLLNIEWELLGTLWGWLMTIIVSIWVAVPLGWSL